MKAVARGFVIQYAAHRKKKMATSQREIENEMGLKRHFYEDGFRGLTKLKYEYNYLVTKSRVLFV